MPEQGRWRISTAYDYIDELDAPDLAWEFLRRNPEYQRDYALLRSEGHDSASALKALSNKWGLSFRSQPRHPCAVSKHELDARSRPVDTNPSGCSHMGSTCFGR
ncbi:transcriptional regulator domain-containing protein [Rhizobium terrae]|uniref:transcriptional regulator domain-containing protein n=1 Tax=Rhizobium terrae TaxID=2171756 RepID=UPI001D0272A3|nr:DUF6499 domain-containing protein [Rhizobium terrae]